MPLLVNIQHLTKHAISLKGELTVEELDLALDDEMIQARTPLKYALQVEKLDNAVLAQGRLRLKLHCQCVRCLKPVIYTVDLPDWACHLPLEGEDAVPVVNDSVDLTPYIREDTLLGLPRHPVCEPECAGLKIAPGGKSKKAASTESGLPSSAWSDLDKLKLQ